MRPALPRVAAALALAVAGCLGSSPSGSGDTGATAGGGNDAGVAGAADLAGAPPPDLTLHPLPRDLGAIDFAGDLAGFVNCFGAAVCDPNTSFCIRLNAGSAANPGTSQSPACYEPVDCMGANMSCDCITQDPVLGPSCVNCVDHMDGTHDCYAQP
jgi:hypothetical protein